AKFDADRVAHVDRLDRLPVLVGCAYGQQPHKIVAWCRLVVWPRSVRAAALRGVQVMRDDLRRLALVDDRAAVEPDGSVAKLVDRLHVVRDEQHGAAGAAEAPQSSTTT